MKVYVCTKGQFAVQSFLMNVRSFFTLANVMSFFSNGRINLILKSNHTSGCHSLDFCVLENLSKNKNTFILFRFKYSACCFVFGVLNILTHRRQFN